VVRVTLTNGPGHNVVDFELGRQFREALAGPARSGRVVEIVAEGPNFCVGGDVRGFAADPDASLTALADDFHSCQRLILGFSQPLVMGVQGWAAGIGLSLALTGDVIVLASGARLRPAYTAIGLTPDGGMTATLPAAVGRARAMDMFLTNRPMGADEALACGLASRVVGDEDLHTETASIAAAIAAGPPQALAATKKLVRTTWRRSRSATAVSRRRAGRAWRRSWRNGRRPGRRDQRVAHNRQGCRGGRDITYLAEATSSGDARNGHVRSSDGILDQDARMAQEMGGDGRAQPGAALRGRLPPGAEARGRGEEALLEGLGRGRRGRDRARRRQLRGRGLAGGHRVGALRAREH
jgi:2-(1,2-epoxy-1,2-dihydrophenyl)acetyl-CoA isomerase